MQSGLPAGGSCGAGAGLCWWRQAKVQVKDLPLTWRHVMNSTRDIMFKRCGCTSEKTGRQFAARCPRLAEPGHGSWYYAVQVTTVGGRKVRYRRGGFATREAAAAVLAGPGRATPAPVHRARLPGPHRPVPHPQHRPYHPRRPDRQAPASLLQPARPPAHQEGNADRRLPPSTASGPRCGQR